MATLHSLFGEQEPEDQLEILPVSVLDIQKQNVRTESAHELKSSRSEFSPFPKEVATTCFEFYLRDSKVVVDPFAGWGERGFYAKKFNKEYHGYDISPTAIKSAKEKFGVINTLADSSTIDPPEFDGFITCPPYWNLEMYDSTNGCDKEDTWEDFLVRYGNILSRFYRKAKSGTKFCIMTGDWRQNHAYYDLEFRTSKIMEILGAKMFDRVIVSRKNCTKIKIMLPQCKRLGYSVKVHEYLNVYVKE